MRLLQKLAGRREREPSVCVFDEHTARNEKSQHATQARRMGIATTRKIRNVARTG
jgi:hypothetical protein